MANAPKYIYGPGSVAYALEGITVPYVSNVLPSTWSVVGDSGSDDYDEAGVRIHFDQTISTVVNSSSPHEVAARRSKAMATVKVKVRDMNVEAFSHALNDNPITHVAATTTYGAFDRVPLELPLEVSQFALCVRFNDSPASAAYNAQFYLPRMYVDGVAEIEFGMEEMAGLEITYKGLIHVTERMGYWDVQTSEATP